MRHAPEGFIIPTHYEDIGPTTKKAVGGALGKMFVEFKVHKEYSGVESELAGREVKKEVEILLCHVDKFSKIPKRVSEIPHKEQMKLAPLYELFKQQKDSTDTHLNEWEAATADEKSHLGVLGVWSVEQLANFSDHELYQLGPNGKELRERAIRHVRSKEAAATPDRSAEFAQIRAQAEEQRKQIEMLQAKLFEKEAAKARVAASKKKKGPKKPKCKVEDESIEA